MIKFLGPTLDSLQMSNEGTLHACIHAQSTHLEAWRVQV